MALCMSRTCTGNEPSKYHVRALPVTVKPLPTLPFGRGDVMTAFPDEPLYPLAREPADAYAAC